VHSAIIHVIVFKPSSNLRYCVTLTKYSPGGIRASLKFKPVLKPRSELQFVFKFNG